MKYLLDILTSEAPNMNAVILCIVGYFIDRYKSIWSKLYKINKKEDIRHNIKNTGIMILNVSSELLVRCGRGGKTDRIGDLQYNLSMVSRLREQTSMLMDDVNDFLVNNTRLIELWQFIAIKPEDHMKKERFNEMCYDPESAMSARPKETMMKMMTEEDKL